MDFPDDGYYDLFTPLFWQIGADWHGFYEFGYQYMQIDALWVLFRFALDTLPVNAVLMRFPTSVLKIRGELRTA